MLHVTPTLLGIALLGASSGLETEARSPDAIRCALAIDDLVIEVNAVAATWEACGEFQGWSLSKWPNLGEPALAQLLDANDDLFAKIDAVLVDPSLRDAVRLTKRVREHGSPSLMDSRNLCNVLCARSVIAVHRGDSTEAATRLAQAVHMGLVMTAEQSIGRSILVGLSWTWRDTLTVLLRAPSFDSVAARAQIDARLARISSELNTDVECMSALVRREALGSLGDVAQPDSEAARDRVLISAAIASRSSQQVLACAQLMRSALAVSSYRRDRAAWPGSIGEAFAELDGVHEMSSRPAELTYLRCTSFGVCIFALVETPLSARLQRLTIALFEP